MNDLSPRGRQKQITTTSSRCLQTGSDDKVTLKRCCSPDEDLCESSQAVKKPRVDQQVRFSADVRVHDFEQRPEDMENLWYSKDDYQRIKQQNQDTISAVQQANGRVQSMDVNEYCVRGLEVQIAYHLLQIPADRQKRVVISVLTMQQVQRKLKQPNEQVLRETSKHVSTQDKLKAWKIASIDAVDLYNNREEDAIDS